MHLRKGRGRRRGGEDMCVYKPPFVNLFMSHFFKRNNIYFVSQNWGRIVKMDEDDSVVSKVPTS